MGRAATSMSCLGDGPPRRRPTPPASTTAAVIAAGRCPLDAFLPLRCGNPRGLDLVLCGAFPCPDVRRASMTLAVVLATEAARLGPGAGPTAELPYESGGSGGTLLGRLLDQFASLNVHDGWIIARRELAEYVRGHGFEVVETKDVADDLRVVAELART